MSETNMLSNSLRVRDGSRRMFQMFRVAAEPRTFPGDNGTCVTLDDARRGGYKPIAVTQLPFMKIDYVAATNCGEHFTDLDGMRGVLACVVMLLHVGLNTAISKLSGGIIDHGAWVLCVDFFFILSGFVLAYSFQSRAPSLANYAVKRIRRLAPVFLFTTVVMFCLSPDAISGWTFVANLLMIQSLFNVGSINFPSWSIPFELYLPAVGLLMWPVLLRIPRAGLAICLGAGGLGAVVLAMDIDVPMLRAASGLGAGFCLFLVRQSSSPVRKRPTLVLALFSTSMIIMALAAKMPLLGAMFYPISALAILYGSRVTTVLSTWPFQSLGRWSYSIYLLHVPVLTAANVIVGEHTMSGSIPGKVAVIIVTLLTAGATYTFVEKPIMASRRNLKSARYAASP
jgi:peptidoglycan/LPS O-acetylase OafA/YrhL